METLKKNYEFKQVLTKGNYYSGKNMQVFIKKNKRNTNRIGIAISTKIAKAVKRNAIKRRIRENYRLIQNEIKQGYDIVFLWKKERAIEYATFFNIKEDIKQLISKANLYKEKE